MGQVLRIEPGTDHMPLALDLSPDTSFEDWMTIGRRLCIGQQAVNWHIGDWWAFGSHHYGDRAQKAAEGLFGKEFQTLMNLASVARKFEASRRREVPFSHHVEVAALPAAVADELLERAEREHLSTRDVRREVQAIKAANDPAIGTVGEPAIARTPPPEFTRQDLEEAYTHYIEAVQALEGFRKLTHRESDFINVAMDFLGLAYADRRPPPDTFDVVLVEHGRVACEAWFNASRITVNRWLSERGKRKLLDERAQFVKYGRQQAHDASHPPAPVIAAACADDPMYRVAKAAADFLRIQRNGGWPISALPDGDWLMGTVRHTSDQLIARAERQGFEPQSLGPVMVQG